MKASLLCLAGAVTSPALANIPVQYKVTLSCDNSSPNYTGCLRGMHCTHDKTCIKASLHPFSTNQNFDTLPKPHLLSRISARAFSENGQCGPNNGDLLCDPDSTVYSGTCCSQYGWCGNTSDYCGQGCVSGCTSTPPVGSTYYIDNPRICSNKDREHVTMTVASTAICQCEVGIDAEVIVLTEPP